ncbi:MAG TPA: class IV adenylate cyclase [Tepidisphaeraceae bacterium]|jgi:predicted adenylyl cyclase CyaB|nr:class IV adenylate cyclase [Tepidisphaeraceae bacterium]
MNRNIEIKARAHDLTETLRLAQALSSSHSEALFQEDVFFGVPAGRLKLRTINHTRSELIFYDRADETGPKCSNYIRFPVSDAVIMRRQLESAFGIRGIVRKSRRLFIVGTTRVHLDEVQELGDFVELEVVLPPDGSAEAAVSTAREIMRKLKVDDASLVAGAYIDLLATAPPAPTS